MRRLKRFFLLLSPLLSLMLVLMLVLTCLLAPIQARAQAKVPVQGNNPACATPSLAWEVTSDTATVWLFGSIHFAAPEAYPLCPPVQQAFARADALAVELDTEARAAEVQDVVMRTAFLPKGQRLSDQLSPEIKELIANQGIDLFLYQAFRPWYFSVLLQVQKFMALGYLPEYGLDLHFLARARERGMPILELETVAEQMGLLKSLAEQNTDAYMRQFLLELAEVDELAHSVFDAWSRGDARGLGEILFGQADEYPEFAPVYEKVYYERNVRMAKTIVGYLHGRQNVFVVVGAGHLVGDRSVLAELAAQGFEARQLRP